MVLPSSTKSSQSCLSQRRPSLSPLRLHLAYRVSKFTFHSIFGFPTRLFILAVVRISYSIRDHERNAKRSITKALTLRSTDSPIDSPVISSSISQDSSEISAFLCAPSEKRHAFLKEISDANGAKKRYVEVWSGTQLEASLEVTKQHGQFHTDGITFPDILFSSTDSFHPLRCL